MTRAYFLCATMIAACLGFSETSFAQSDEAVGNALGNLIVGIFNNAQASSIRDSWRKLDPAIQICLIQAYRLRPAQFAQQGIKATDKRIVPLIQDCERRNADLLAGMSEYQRDGFNRNALIIANQEAEAMKVQAQRAGTQLFAQTFRDGLVVAKEAIDEAERRKEQERISAENERRRLAYEAQLAEQRRIDEERRKAEEDRRKALLPPAPPQTPAVEAPPQRPVEVAKGEEPQPAPVQEAPPQPVQPTPVAAPTPPPQQAVSSPAPSVTGNEPVTFFEHRADDGTVMTVSVYQNGQLISTTEPQRAAAGYGYQAGISGSYQVPGGSVAKNVQTTPGSRAPIDSMPEKMADAERVIATTPSRPPSAPSTDNPGFNGGSVGNAPPASSNNPGTPSGSNYTFVQTGQNMVQIYLNGQRVSGGTPQYAAQFGYTGPGSNAPPSDYNRPNPPPEQVASVQPSPIQQTSPTPYTPPKTDSPLGGNATPGPNNTAPPTLDLPDGGRFKTPNNSPPSITPIGPTPAPDNSQILKDTITGIPKAAVDLYGPPIKEGVELAYELSPLSSVADVASGARDGDGTKIFVGLVGLTPIGKFGKTGALLASEKILQQVGKRGWTSYEIEATVANSIKTGKTFERATGQPATAYFDARGNYVVVNDISGNIVQVSDKLNPWVTDSAIRINP